MHRLLVLYPPPSDPDHFRRYYEGTHLPLVAKFPGLRGYRYSFEVATAEGDSPYYCVFEADFGDAAALSAARESPEGQVVRADVPNYATGGAVVLDYEIRAGLQPSILRSRVSESHQRSVSRGGTGTSGTRVPGREWRRSAVSAAAVRPGPGRRPLPASVASAV